MYNIEVRDAAWYRKQARAINQTMYQISWMHPLGITKHKIEVILTLQRIVFFAKTFTNEFKRRQPYQNNHDKKKSVRTS